MIKYELHLCQSPAQEEALSFLNSLSLSGEVGLQLAGMGGMEGCWDGDGGMLRWRDAGMGIEGCWDGGMLGWGVGMLLHQGNQEETTFSAL